MQSCSLKMETIEIQYTNNSKQKEKNPKQNKKKKHTKIKINITPNTSNLNNVKVVNTLV